MILQHCRGYRNMGTVGDPATVPRFGLARQRWRLHYMQCQFSGGTGDAQITFKLDRGLGQSHLNRTLLITEATNDDQGTDGPNGPFFNMRVADDEAKQWTFPAGSYIVPEWTNPDAGNMQWTWEVAIDAVD